MRPSAFVDPRAFIGANPENAANFCIARRFGRNLSDCQGQTLQKKTSAEYSRTNSGGQPPAASRCLSADNCRFARPRTRRSSEGLDRLFSPSQAELSLRISANIAAYLEPPGRGRHVCFQKRQKHGLTAGLKPRTEVAKPTSRPYAKSNAIAQTCSFEDD